ncbi:MAG TPA: fructosamine kinase family protein [Anaerolineales bacterium]|nr:fructosamine kinase family protein [Anaerolineales bacterium]
MNLPQPIVEWCRAQGFGAITQAIPQGGGCIHACYRLMIDGGRTLFLKVNDGVPEDMFPCEADGLMALALGTGPRLPHALLWGPTFLLLEDLSPSRNVAGFWERLGRELAQLHSRTCPRFGFDHTNYIGLTPQPNGWTPDGHAFFAERRLLFQARRARDSGLLEKADLGQVEALCARLDRLLPDQPACLIHGDLWSGNVLRGPNGEPCLVDPACHYGWAEAELGMTELFGGFPETFYGAYAEASRLPPGWRDRLPVYNLYHLLNHLNLFGGSYLGSVRSVLQAFT